MQMRWMNPDQRRQLRTDPSITGASNCFQVNGPCSIQLLPNMGTVRVQVNNDKMYLTRNGYGIGISPDAVHFPDPTVNPSFSRSWADAGSITAATSASYQFLNVPVWRRYVRITSTALSSSTGNVLAGFIFARPRI